MQGLGKIGILFIAGFGPVVRDTNTSRGLYGDALDIPFQEEIVSRSLDPDGLLVGLTFTPSRCERKMAWFLVKDRIESEGTR